MRPRIHNGRFDALKAPLRGTALTLAIAFILGSGLLPVQPGLASSAAQSHAPDGAPTAVEGLATAQIVWIRQLGSGSAEGIAGDADGNVYVVGSFIQVRFFNGCPALAEWRGGIQDAFLRKYDADGNLLWTQWIRTSGWDGGAGVKVDSTGVYVTGPTFGKFPGFHNAGESDVYVRKYDVEGNELWTRQFGGSGVDASYGIDSDATGIYVAGLTCSQLGTLPGAESGNAFVTKLDFNGSVEWIHQFGTAYAFGVSEHDGIYVTGPGFVRKLDPNGREVWTQEFGACVGRGIAAGAPGIYVTGYSYAEICGSSLAGNLDALVQKYDANGDILWTRQFGTSANDSAVAVAVDATGVNVGGSTDGTFPNQVTAGGFDAFVRRYGPDGEEGWTVQFGSSESDVVLDLEVHSSAVYVGGWTSGTLPGQTSTGGLDGFVAKLEVAVNEPPVVTEIKASHGVTIPGQGITFAATASDSDGYIRAWTWNFGDGAVGHFDAAPGLSTITNTTTHSYAEPGTYTVTLVVEDDGNGVTAKSATVRVVAPLSLEISADPITGAAPLIVSFAASPSGGVPPYSFDWDFGDGDSSTSQSPSHTYLAAGTYTIKLNITDADGHAVIRTIQITVESQTAPVRPESMPTWVPYVGVVAIAIGIGGALLLRHRRRLRMPPPPPSA